MNLSDRRDPARPLDVTRLASMVEGEARRALSEAQRQADPALPSDVAAAIEAEAVS